MASQCIPLTNRPSGSSKQRSAALPAVKTVAAILAGGAALSFVWNWSRFGHKGGPPSASDALDGFMSRYDVRELHQVRLQAPAQTALAAAERLHLESLPTVRLLFRAREILLQAKHEPFGSKGLVEQLTKIGWVELSRSSVESVMGSVVRPWARDLRFLSIPPSKFAAFSEPDYVKIVWNLRADPVSGGGTNLSTETRAIATDHFARRRFRLYWGLFAPGIRTIRTAALRELRRELSPAGHRQSHSANLTA